MQCLLGEDAKAGDNNVHLLLDDVYKTRDTVANTIIKIWLLGEE